MSKRVLAVLILMFLMLGVIAFQPAAASSSDDWPMFHHDPAHSGVGTGNPVLIPNLLWKDNVSNVDEWSAPTIVDGVVYIGSSYGPSGYYNSTFHAEANVYAFNASDGKVIWDYKNDTWGGVKAAPAVVNNVVYFGSNDYFGALNASNGASLWNFTANDAESSPTVVNGVLYFGTYDGGIGNVYALNAADGSKIWNYTTGGGVGSSPAVVNGVVYVGSLDHNVYALNASTGAKLWNYTTGGNVGSPAVVNGVVYVGSLDHNVYALNASTGSKLWNFATGNLVRSSPAVVNGVVYVGSDDGNVYALNAADGKKLWNYTTRGPVASSPAVVDEIVYVGSGLADDNVYALNVTNGVELWSHRMGGGIAVGSPAIADGVLYVGSDHVGAYSSVICALGTLTASSVSPPVSEFPSWVILPFVIAAATAALAYAKKKLCKQAFR